MIYNNNIQYFPLVEKIILSGYNNQCIDCGADRPEWASINNGVFLCGHCAGLHKQLGSDISLLKSLTVDTWTEKEIQMLHNGGNSRFKANLESFGLSNFLTNNLHYKSNEIGLEQIEKKYLLVASDYYRKLLKSEVDMETAPYKPDQISGGRYIDTSHMNRDNFFGVGGKENYGGNFLGEKQINQQSIISDDIRQENVPHPIVQTHITQEPLQSNFIGQENLGPKSGEKNLLDRKNVGYTVVQQPLCHDAKVNCGLEKCTNKYCDNPNHKQSIAAKMGNMLDKVKVKISDGLHGVANKIDGDVYHGKDVYRSEEHLDRNKF